MKLALLQSENNALDSEGNLATLRVRAAEARDAGAELLLTSELFVSGYAPQALAEWLTPARVAAYPASIAAIAREEAMALAVSYPALAADGSSYEIVVELWDETGASVLRYAKTHLWGEEEPLAFVPNHEAPLVAEWHGYRVGFQICYDIEFPEPTRFLATLGANLVLVPTAVDEHSAYVPEVLVRARAAENVVTVAYANHSAAADGFSGGSTVAGPEGRVLARAEQETGLLFAEVPAPIPVPRGVANYLADRLPEAYENWGREAAAGRSS